MNPPLAARPEIDSQDRFRRRVYDASGTLVHIDDKGTGTTTDYVSGAGMTLARIKNGVPTYLHLDHLGSAVSATTLSGSIDWQEHYTPFGEARSGHASNDNQAGFTGHIKDQATGLNYMQARYYDPVMGRFLSVDPVGFVESGHPGSFNRYAYTFNDPINLVDPDGNHPALAKKAVQKIARKQIKSSLKKRLMTSAANIEKIDTAIDLGFAAMDGPAALAGELVSIGIEKVAGKFNSVKKTFQTYTKPPKNSSTHNTYSGRTSGTGTPEQNVANRDSGHHMNDTHGPSVLDKSSNRSDAIRGREQRLIESNGGAQSQLGTSGNINNGIADKNPNREIYLKACKEEFGC